MRVSRSWKSVLFSFSFTYMQICIWLWIKPSSLFQIYWFCLLFFAWCVSLEVKGFYILYHLYENICIIFIALYHRHLWPSGWYTFVSQPFYLKATWILSILVVCCCNNGVANTFFFLSTFFFIDFIENRTRNGLSQKTALRTVKNILTEKINMTASWMF